MVWICCISLYLVTLCQLAGALAEEGCSLDQIVVKVTEVLKEIGESLCH